MESRRPSMATVTVLGAGAVGVSVALYLQREGFEVRLVDQDEPGRGCSYGNAGLIQCASVVPVATPGILRQVPRMLLDPDQPLVVRWRHLPSISPYLARFLAEAMPKRVKANSRALASIVPSAYAAYEPLIAAAGIQHMVQCSGELHVYETMQAFEAAKVVHSIRREHGCRVEVLDRDQVLDLEPALSPTIRRGVFLPEAYQTVSPYRFVHALAQHFVSCGGTVSKARVKDLSVPETGPVEIRTDQGRLKADNIVIALGAFSRPWIAKLGSRVNLNSERGYHLMLPRPEVLLSRAVLSGEYRFAMAPIDGGVMLAGTAELAQIGAPANYDRAKRLLPLAKRLLPGLDDAGQSMWMGHRPSTPDSLPVIGRSPQHRNVYFAFGHNHSGLTLGGVTGKLIAELVAGKEPSINLAPFSIARFHQWPVEFRRRSVG